jgi:hypothetical protein
VDAQQRRAGATGHGRTGESDGAVVVSEWKHRLCEPAERQAVHGVEALPPLVVPHRTRRVAVLAVGVDDAVVVQVVARVVQAEVMAQLVHDQPAASMPRPRAVRGEHNKRHDEDSVTKEYSVTTRQQQQQSHTHHTGTCKETHEHPPARKTHTRVRAHRHTDGRSSPDCPRRTWGRTAF